VKAHPVEADRRAYIGWMTAAAADVVEFWREAGSKAWFAKDASFDNAIRERFERVHHAAARGELESWGESAKGSLALLLLLDQFPRNIWRGSPHAFATDPLARRIARRAIAAGHDKEVAADLRPFFYLPFEHSENRADQDAGLAYCEALEMEGGENAKWARLHHGIIVRFGRFPHRNQSLGRDTTVEEQAFLDEGGFHG
jgi:uncharacterized protein (DUF924 family)